MKLIIITEDFSEDHIRSVKNTMNIWDGRGSVDIITPDSADYDVFSKLYPDNNVIFLHKDLGSGNSLLEAYGFSKIFSEIFVIVQSGTWLYDGSIFDELIEDSSGWLKCDDYSVSVTKRRGHGHEIVTYLDSDEVYYTTDLTDTDSWQEAEKLMDNGVYIFNSAKLLDKLSELSTYLHNGSRYITENRKLDIRNVFHVLTGKVVLNMAGTSDFKL